MVYNYLKHLHQTLGFNNGVLLSNPGNRLGQIMTSTIKTKTF